MIENTSSRISCNVIWVWGFLVGEREEKGTFFCCYCFCSLIGAQGELELCEVLCQCFCICVHDMSHLCVCTHTHTLSVASGNAAVKTCVLILFHMHWAFEIKTKKRRRHFLNPSKMLCITCLCAVSWKIYCLRAMTYGLVFSGRKAKGDCGRPGTRHKQEEQQKQAACSQQSTGWFQLHAGEVLGFSAIFWICCQRMSPWYSGCPDTFWNTICFPHQCNLPWTTGVVWGGGSGCNRLVTLSGKLH